MALSRMTDEIGRVLGGRYRLLAPIGTGASAQVFLADDARLRRRVAVKMLHPGLAGDGDFLRRFQAEAQAAAALNHPHVLAVYDWGHDEVPFLVTEFLGGGSLRALLDAGELLSPAQALLVGLDAGRGLDYAHSRGLVHRDMKPANLLFGEDGRLRIADFGLARALAEAAWTEPTGAVLGTARYASPEQARGESVDGRGDVYSLALVLVEAVTGAVPFSADTTIGTLMARVDRPLVVPDALGPLAQALGRAGRSDPAERPDAAGFVVALLACAERLDRPAPLPLAGARVLDPGALPDDRDPTLLPGANGAHGDVDHAGATSPGDDPAGVAGARPSRRARRKARRTERSALRTDRPRERRRWPIALVVVLLLGLAGAAGAFALTQESVPTHEVPRLEDQTLEVARSLVADFGWEIDETPLRRDGTSRGDVLAQDPRPGEELAEGETLELVVSFGQTLSTVPDDLVGLPESDVTAALAELELGVEVEPRFDEDAAEGTVLEVGSVAEELEKGTAVALVVSAGPEPRTIPDGLAGLTTDDATARLAAIGLGADVVEERFSDDVEAGRVIATSPGTGEQAQRGAVVGLVISRGPDLVAVPDVSGSDNLAGAVAALEAAGLEAGSVSGPARGRPFSTDPAPGTQVRRGSTVDIFLRR